MSKILAIKGDWEKGNEVIALLEMLGGYADELIDNGTDEKYAYFIVKDENDVIDAFPIDNKDGFGFDALIFTIDEFYKKYPYKVGDIVKTGKDEEGVIKQMRWVDNNVVYWVNSHKTCDWTQTLSVDVLDKYNRLNSNDIEHSMEIKVETTVRDRDDILFDSIIWHLRNSVNNGKQHLSGGNCEAYFRELVKKVKMNDMESCKGTVYEDIKKVAYLSINDKDYADEIEINLNDDYEYKFEMNRLYILKKKPKYPTTYKECCDVLKIPNDERYIDIDVPLDYNKLLSVFTELLICRKAYYKIYGEQMRLDKPWEPNWNDGDNKFVIQYLDNEVGFWLSRGLNYILAFPTAEMRDAFYENFKDLIEKCKELL